MNERICDLRFVVCGLAHPPCCSALPPRQSMSPPIHQSTALCHPKCNDRVTVTFFPTRSSPVTSEIQIPRPRNTYPSLEARALKTRPRKQKMTSCSHKPKQTNTSQEGHPCRGASRKHPPAPRFARDARRRPGPNVFFSRISPISWSLTPPPPPSSAPPSGPKSMTRNATGTVRYFGALAFRNAEPSQITNLKSQIP